MGEGKQDQQLEPSSLGEGISAKAFYWKPHLRLILRKNSRCLKLSTSFHRVGTYSRRASVHPADFNDLRADFLDRRVFQNVEAQPIGNKHNQCSRSAQKIFLKVIFRVKFALICLHNSPDINKTWIHLIIKKKVWRFLWFPFGFGISWLSEIRELGGELSEYPRWPKSRHFEIYTPSTNSKTDWQYTGFLIFLNINWRLHLSEKKLLTQ